MEQTVEDWHLSVHRGRSTDSGHNGVARLEIANVGPFHFVLQEGDVIAQLTVASVMSPPDLSLKTSSSATARQAHVSGRAERRSRGRTTRDV
jgi:deoxycytidine triphosphate deaminase